jgi:Zn-dependent protease with chaperone function
MIFRWLRWTVLILLIIGIPIFVYFGFLADEPAFDVEYDVELGRQHAESIEADTSMVLLDKDEYPEAYAHLQRIVDEVVRSDEIQYRDLFAYDDVRIIQDDETLNAFCAPGGFIYVYSGLIKYLEEEDHLAGVLGHEIAHAELRHSSLRLQRDFGRQKLLDLILLSQPLSNAAVAAVLNQLNTLSFSRDQEAASDRMSVRYLAGSRYACNGVGGFFERLQREGDGVDIPPILSDHPGDVDRIRDIGAEAVRLGCSTDLAEGGSWLAFQASLP